MAKATEKKPVEEVNAVPEAVEEQVEKPYTFRKLGAPDIFLLAKIISKIGINELKVCFESDGIKNMILNVFRKQQEEGGEDADSSLIGVGISVSLEIANTILLNLPKCENEIYQLLAQTSNLTVDEIKAPGNGVMFVEMVIEFIRKEEFKDFFKAASRLFK